MRKTSDYPCVANMAVSETFYDACGIILALIRGTNIVDLGCGLGARGYTIRVRLNDPSILVGLDVCKENLYRVKRHRIYDDLVLATLPFIPFREKSFDTVLCLDVIEHLNKVDGLRVMKRIERLAKKRIVITTPTLRTVFSNPEHISAWSARDFKKLGYKVIGLRFRHHSYFSNLKYVIIWLFELIGRYITHLASILIAYKDLNERR